MPSNRFTSNDAVVMPSSHTSDNDNLLVHTELITLAGGHRMPHETPSSLVQQLYQTCQDGSLAEAEQILNRITPFPTSGIPLAAMMVLVDCLRTAVAQKRLDLVCAMLQRGFNSNKLSATPINDAFNAADTNTLKIFLDYGWDVNEVGDDSMRPLLRRAVHSDQPDVRRLLLAHGADPNIPDDRGWTTLETSVMFSSIEVVWELLEHGGDPALDDSLIYAAGLGRLDVATLLVQRGADVNALPKELPFPWGQERRANALGTAIARNHQHMVRWLESHGATARDGSLGFGGPQGAYGCTPFG